MRASACRRSSSRRARHRPARRTRVAARSCTLYQGGQYFLYKYKRYTDVRIVFAPEDAIAAFGGDPDNFQFPRWCLDMSMLRAYENGKPVKTPNHLRINWAGAAENELVFVTGHPGSTDRQLTLAQLQEQRESTAVLAAARCRAARPLHPVRQDRRPRTRASWPIR